MPEVCICAAVLAEDDTVIRCQSHADGLHALRFRKKKLKHGSSMYTQGFVTSHGRYVDRYEGMRLQLAAGIKSADKDGYRGDILFSEDLY